MVEKRLNRERMEPLMKSALAEVPAIFAALPLEWLHVDGDKSLPVQLDRERVTSGVACRLCRDESGGRMSGVAYWLCRDQ